MQVGRARLRHLWRSPRGAATPPAADRRAGMVGLNEHIRDVARRWDAKVLAIAPACTRARATSSRLIPITAAQLMAGLKKENGIEDLQTTVEWLRAAE